MVLVSCVSAHVVPDVDLSWIQWGDAAGWAQAVGNFAVLFVAILTIRKDSQRIASLERRSREDEVAQARERVYGVTAWPQEWAIGSTRIVVNNASLMPVYDVTVRASSTGAHSQPPQRGVDGAKSVFIVNPGESLEAQLEWSLDTRPIVDLQFRDSGGWSWWREADGTMECVDRKA